MRRFAAFFNVRFFIQRRLPFTCLFVMFVLLLTVSCGSRPEKAAVTSGLRVVSLIPNVTTIMFELDAGDMLVGVTRYCDKPEKAKSIPRVGGILDVSVEALAAVKPDLVIGSPVILRGRLTDILGEAGVRFLPLEFEDIEDVRAGILKIGDAVGRHEKAASKVADMDRALLALAGSVPPVRALFVVGSKPLVVASVSSFQGQLMQAMGLKNVVDSEKVRFPTWSFEQVIKAAPDVIIDGIVRGEPSAALLAGAGVKAPIVSIPDDSILLPGPGAIEGAARLAAEVRKALAAPARGIRD